MGNQVEPKIELPVEVVGPTDIRFKVTGVRLLDTKTGTTHTIDIAIFAYDYEEYIDPKDLEIQRLLAENKKLKDRLKPERKKRRVLTPGEIKEIKELIDKGESNPVIAKEYGSSDSTISRIRKLRETEVVYTVN